MAEGNNKRYRGFLIALACFGAGMILGFGLCNVTLAGVVNRTIPMEFNLPGIFGMLFFVSLIGFAITLVGLVVALIINAFSN